MSDRTAKAPRWALWLPLALFGVFVVLVIVGLLRPASHDIPSRMIGQPLPAFNLPAAADGKPGLSNKDFNGKPRLLNIFASWCIPCGVEAPVLAELQRQGVEIDGIAIRDHKAELAGFLARNGDPYARIGADDISAVQLAIGSSGVPESFVVDGKGVIRYQHIGDIRPEQVPMIVQKLKEAGQ
ncbi:MAG: DsbE family thiol:disulfide interchange protein [Sphingomonadales bacterium]|nr:DsbE family thiol:disulfide interchange protein [Sphingomonadales bacterium]